MNLPQAGPPRCVAADRRGSSNKDEQPTAACAMQSNDILRHSDATKQCAAHSGVHTAEQRNGAKRRNSSAFGSNKRNTQPTAACALQSNESLRHSDATKATRSPQRRARCRAAIVCSLRVRRTQCATHSGVRTAEQRNSWAFGCDESNTHCEDGFLILRYTGV